MPKLAESYSVTAADIRGMGQSEKLGSGYDLETMSGDAVQLMSALGHGSFLYAGHDIGAWVGYSAAAKYPDRIRKEVPTDAAVPRARPIAGTRDRSRPLRARQAHKFHELADIAVSRHP